LSEFAMMLPANIALVIERLNTEGYKAYAVGGCVRDAMRGVSPHDYDITTSALPQQVKAVFSDRQVIETGISHGTVTVLMDGAPVEITTFRVDGEYLDNRHPAGVQFTARIEDDLSRRDFTVNAMAFSPTRGLIDPFGGQANLENRILRAVGDPMQRFREDSLRILRGVRFAVRFALTPEQQTENAMTQLAPLMENLARERVFEELCQLLPLVNAADLLRYAPILTQVIPFLGETVGFLQHSPHHAYDVFTHTAYVTAAVSADLPLRWAALLHDVGKPAAFTTDETGRGHFYGHAQLGAQRANEILLQLKAPTALRGRVVFLIEHHMDTILPERKTLRRQLGRYGQEALAQLLELQKADFCSKGVTGDAPQFAQIQGLIAEILDEESCLSLKDLAVNGNDLQALGLTGKAIGATLNALLDKVLEEQLPNEKDALLAAVKTL